MGPQSHSQWKWAPSPILSGNGGSPLIFSSSEYSHSPSSIFITVSDYVLPNRAGTELVSLVTPFSVEMGPQSHSQWKWAPTPILSGNGGSPLIFSGSEYSHSPSSIFITVSDYVLPNRAGTELVTLVTPILSGNGPPAPFSVEMGHPILSGNGPPAPFSVEMGDHHSFSVAVSIHIVHHLSSSQFQIMCYPIELEQS
jgi:hypothetical protein